MTRFLSYTLIFCLTFAGVALGQSAPPRKVSNNATENNDVRRAVEEQTKLIQSQGETVDARQMEKELLRGAKKKGGMTTKQKTWLVLGIIGTAALIFVLVKYYRECLRYEDNCIPGNETCLCEEYAPRN